MFGPNRAGPHSTVSPPGGRAQGPIEKFDPPPRPNLGPTPDFKISFCGYAEGLQSPKIWRENLSLFSRYESLNVALCDLGREIRWTHGRCMEQWRYTLRTSGGT